MDVSSTKVVTLKSSDGKEFEVEEAVALQMQTVKQMINDVSSDGKIFLSNVTGRILSMVIEYCKKHVKKDGDIKKWDAEFVDVEKDTFLELSIAACYLDINSLCKLIAENMASKIMHMTLEESRKFFNVKAKDVPTPEELKELESRFQWAFDY